MTDALDVNIIFRDVLTEHCICKSPEWTNWHIKRAEWKEVHGGPAASNCICTTRIDKLYWIQNIHTGKILTIGSSCINKFGIERKPLQCDTCNDVIRTAIDKRVKNKDMTCNKCKANIRKEIKTLSTTIWFYDNCCNRRYSQVFPWTTMEFKDILKNIEWATRIYNFDKDDYRYMILNNKKKYFADEILLVQKFRRYCDLTCEVTDA